jgi:hypothetical protein
MSEDCPEIHELTSLSERRLQAEIVEPLLRALGYREVTDNSGPGEKGKDLIAVKDEGFGRPKLYAIQIKRLKITAKAGADAGFGRLLDQLRQLVQEPVLDPVVNEYRVPDRCVFITPYPLPQRARENFAFRMKQSVYRPIEIVDGSDLLDLLRQHARHALRRFSIESQYRLQVAAHTNVVSESAAAFQLGHPLQLDNIYVELSLLQDARLEAVLNAPPMRPVEVPLPDARPFGDVYAYWTGEPAETIPGRCEAVRRKTEQQIRKEEWRAKKRLHRVEQEVAGGRHDRRRRKTKTREQIEAALDTTRARLRNNQRVEVDLGAVLRSVQRRVHEHVASLGALSNPDSSIDRCIEISRASIELQNALRELMGTQIWKNYKADSPPIPIQRLLVPRIRSSFLSRIDVDIYLLGAPGAGKTTLSRRLTQELARFDGNVLPLFLPLVSVKVPTYAGLIDACFKELQGRGYRARKARPGRESFVAELDAGRFRLFLDGLDEAGERAPAMLDAIKQLRKKHAACRLLVTARDTFGVPDWFEALTLRIDAFSDEQVLEFIGRWFSSEPSSRDALNAFLRKNEHMRSAVRTPLIAALLCSLFQIGVEMPATELELYQRRFELLMGTWEKAKGIVPLAPPVRQRYEHFLRSLAMHQHLAQERSSMHKEARRFAEKYWVRDLHRGPDALVEDCVRRGLLERADNGELSFGHLTYQEYMAGEWLSDRNPVQFIWSRVVTPWWARVLEFYAARKADISPVLREALKWQGTGESMDRLCQLVELAPLTSKELVRRLKVQPRTSPLSPFEWERKPPSLDV